MIIDSRYLVTETLATSSKAIVYKVKDSRTAKTYILKLFKNIESDELYRKFSAEDMHHITKIMHSNLIHVSSFGINDKEIYLLSEYYAGKSFTFYNFKAFHLDIFYGMIVQMCYGLNALHSQEIIHQDLKPENIMYQLHGDKPQVKILDYGFSRNVQSEDTKFSGTLPYTAPEVLTGVSPSPGSDFYSLGVTLYKITTGTFPFTLEQIVNFVSGKSQMFFPKFPSELNPDIPVKLEKLILKLLEIKPKNRFTSAEEIIAYINRIQKKKYPFSTQRSIVDRMKYSSYLVREDYCRSLLKYLPIIEDRNGKIIILKSGVGLGKNNILSLFRYHLLSDKYFVFDYECSATSKDPFFALNKEFYSFLVKNESLAADMDLMSKRFHKYLYESEEEAVALESNESDLQRDFEVARDFILKLSEERSLVFIIRHAQHLTADTINFVNYIYKNVVTSRILIILSLNDPKALSGITHPVEIRVAELEYEHAKSYIKKLLSADPGEDFMQQLWIRTNGNPYFIRETLIDLTKNRKIWNPDFNEYSFDFNFDNYSLPRHLKDSIDERLAKLFPETYEFLKKISISHTPLSKQYIKFILKISDHKFIYLLKDAIENEIICKRGEFYEFSFLEAKEKLLSEVKYAEKHAISIEILNYFDDKEITIAKFCVGLIDNAMIADDQGRVRKYKLRLLKIYRDQNKHEESFEIIKKIVQMDFAGKLELSEKEIKHDLNLFVLNALLSGLIETALNTINVLTNIPEIFDKYYIKGILYSSLQNSSEAEKNFKKADKLARNDKDKARCLLNWGWQLVLLNKLNLAKKYFDKVAKIPKDRITDLMYLDRKALLLNASNQRIDAINLLEETLARIPEVNDVEYLIYYGNIHNNLAFLYADVPEIEQANIHFEKAKQLWEQIQYKKALPTVYNNIGDLAVRQGLAKKALHYFTMAQDMYNDIELKAGQILGFINFGEIYIKTGNFKKAVHFLKKAEDLIKEIKNESLLPTVQDNLALAYSKINDFGKYYSFIKKTKPEIIKGKFTEVNPLVKTYIYYLIQTGQEERVKLLLDNNSNSNMTDVKLSEFFDQIQGIISFAEGNIQTAISQFDASLQFCVRGRTFYGQTINQIRLAECYIKIKDIKTAQEYYQKALEKADNYGFNYWKCYLVLIEVKIGLQNPEIPLRHLLRKLFVNLDIIRGHAYFLLHLETLKLITQIYLELFSSAKADYYFDLLLAKLEEVTANIPQIDKNAFIEKYNCLDKNILSLKISSIANRSHCQTHVWHEDLYDLIKLKNTERITFFIEKLINKLISPYSFCILLENELEYQVFTAVNFEEDVIHRDSYQDIINECLEKGRIVKSTISSRNHLFVPLGIKRAKVGVMILTDDGELSFSDLEMEIVRELRLHLSAILMRIQEYSVMTKDMNLMSMMMNKTRQFFSMLNLEKLEREIVNFAIEFTNSTRGLLIKKNEDGGYVYQVAVNDKGEFISNESSISKTVLGEVQRTGQAIFTYNAAEDNTFKNSISVQDYDLHSIYCAPLRVDDYVYGFLYLDDYEATKIQMDVKQEFMDSLLQQISGALSNATQYNALMEKTMELHSLDEVKEDFMGIVSHELNTPLVALQGYINKLLKERYKSNTERLEINKKIKNNLHRLMVTTNDIINMNRYRMSTSLKMDLTNVTELFNLLRDEALLSLDGRMIDIRLELEPNIPKIMINEQAFHLMVYNLILNSIRFTRDNGFIQLSVRRSAFADEELNGQESLIISVMDNGDGVPEEELKNIFKSFYEIKNIYSHKSGTTEYNSCGLGLGLTTVKRIVELHGGRIWIKSKENSGTTVYIAMAVPIKE